MVTGGAGFIGSHLVDGLLNAGTEHVTVVDTFFLGSEANLRTAGRRSTGTLSIYREDAGDHVLMSEILDIEKPEVVFNLATKALLYSFLNPSGACQVNLSIALTLCELLRKGASTAWCTCPVPRSTAPRAMCRWTRITRCWPRPPTRPGRRQRISPWHRTFGCSIWTWSRSVPSTTTGHARTKGCSAAVVPLTIKRILANEQPVVEGDGTQTRDLIYVEDTVRALVAAATTPEARGLTMNVASGIETRIGDLVERICKVMGWTGGIRTDDRRRADVHRHMADVALASAMLGELSTTSLDEGLERTVDWYRRQGSEA
ncbi:MAG: GDP-mannose 4,6-dehydratase [Microthrixaceae bacterium]|nr:GDP-mannose 4,6-dehydratase [Microthrixaceae bacterium]